MICIKEIYESVMFIFNIFYATTNGLVANFNISDFNGNNYNRNTMPG